MEKRSREEKKKIGMCKKSEMNLTKRTESGE